MGTGVKYGSGKTRHWVFVLGLGLVSLMEMVSVGEVIRDNYTTVTLVVN